MKTIYDTAILSVANGARFWISFKERSLKINGKYVIKDGKYEGELGCKVLSPISEIERLYDRYNHSVPSERSSNKKHRYFRALPEHLLSDEDMMFGVHREEAQIALELFVLCQVLQGTFQWDEFALDKWFWQSPNHPSLIILKNWF